MDTEIFSHQRQKANHEEDDYDYFTTNVHVRPYWTIGSICIGAYDVIVKTETYDEDIEYIFSAMNLKVCQDETSDNNLELFKSHEKI